MTDNIFKKFIIIHNGIMFNLSFVVTFESTWTNLYLSYVILYKRWLVCRSYMRTVY